MAPAPTRRRWVTKTDLTRYVRCPYAFWLLDTGQVTFAETITPLQAGLIEQGVAFHEHVEAQAAPIAEEVDLATLFRRDGLRLVELPLLANAELAFRGVPDGVDTEGGALVPVEFKSHRDVLPSDKLELAFYWLLLEPYRTRHDITPRGVLILRRDGVEVEVDVELAARHFDEVRRLAAEVRQARSDGVEPRVCSCTVCSGPKREEILRRAHHGRDLTLIWGIGRCLAAELETLGMRSYTDLVDVDQAELLAALRARKRAVSAAAVNGWCRHAESYTRAEAVSFGDQPPLPGSFIALDLEYGPHVWLLGACVVDGDRRDTVQLWADTPAEERRGLRALARLIEANPGLPLLTWNGLGADLPELRRAGARHRLARLVEAALARHLDLYKHAGAGVRLPVPTLALSEVAAYFGVARVSAVAGGFDAQTRYGIYAVSPPGPERNQLRDELLEYNRDDLVALVAVAEGLARLEAARSLRPAA